MTNMITLSCPSCGGKLQIAKETERYLCEYCGNEHLVKHTRETNAGGDKAASELAIPRLKKEIEEILEKINEVKHQFSTRQNFEQEKQGRIAKTNRDLAVGFILVGIILVAINLCRINISGANKDFTWLAGGILATVLGIFILRSKAAKPEVRELAFTNGETEKIQELETLLNKKKIELEQHRKIVEL